MWPFTPKTLYDRYSKLMKLIMSIDSHFEVTENKEDSVRLHLPNYKGNQPMDFHIYLMEPFLFMSFVTEIEGEKVSVVNSYPQDMDQQDVFNASMASNLGRMHQVIEEKSKKEEAKNKLTEGDETAMKPIKEKEKKIGVKNTWSLLAFAREHGKMQVGEFANKETGDVFKACIFTKPDGTRTFIAFSTKLGELTPKEIATQKDELYVVQLESGNYSLCKRRNDDWEDVALDNGEQSISSKHDETPAIDTPKETRQASSRDEKRVNWMNLNEIKKEAVAPYASLTTQTEIKEWPTFTGSGKNNRPPKETKPTSSHYLAVAIDMVIAIVAGISVYNSNMIHLEQDRMLFLVMCSILSIVAWGYPYFDTSVKVDHDGCFAQGCIHPIIGVFGILFFPLFIHYWMYKGIKACIGLIKRNSNRSSNKK